MTMPQEPDLVRVTAALAELQKLADAGALTKTEFLRLWAEVESAQGDEDCLEALFPFAQAEDWIPAAYR